MHEEGFISLNLIGGTILDVYGLIWIRKRRDGERIEEESENIVGLGYLCYAIKELDLELSE